MKNEILYDTNVFLFQQQKKEKFNFSRERREVNVNKKSKGRQELDEEKSYENVYLVWRMHSTVFR